MKMEQQAEISQVAIEEMKQELKRELRDEMRLLLTELKETASREGNDRSIHQHQRQMNSQRPPQKQTSPDLFLKMF